jgi:bis(5'-nucleosidyl)-tetraphosphatase
MPQRESSPGRTPSDHGGRGRYERSAGVIVYSDHGGTRIYLLLDYGKYWDFPKGHLEPGEDDRTAAVRELAEETGLDEVTFVEGFYREITYYFRSRGDGSVVRKEVCFFLGRTTSHNVRLSDEHVGFAFLPFDEAVARVKYPTAKELLRQAEQRLNASA